MKIHVRKITNLEDAREALRSTIKDDRDIKATLDELYRWEHSPMRTQMFFISMLGIPTFVSVHLVRHGDSGKCHFVETNRLDRGGEQGVGRWTPVNHTMFVNAQHLVDISRKRLCGQASPETREVWGEIRQALQVIDPDLAKYMVPNCIYRGGYCPEPRPCGFYPGVKKYNPILIAKEIQ